MCVHGIIGLSLRQIRSRDAGLGLPFLKLYSLEYQKGQIIKFKFEGTFLLRHSSRDVTILLFFFEYDIVKFLLLVFTVDLYPKKEGSPLVVEAFLGLITETISLGIFFSSESFIWK